MRRDAGEARRKREWMLIIGRGARRASRRGRRRRLGARAHERRGEGEKWVTDLTAARGGARETGRRPCVASPRRPDCGVVQHAARRAEHARLSLRGLDMHSIDHMFAGCVSTPPPAGAGVEDQLDVMKALIGTTLLFLALCDYGRGRDAQAWREVGAVVRVTQELGLDGGEGGEAKEEGVSSARDLIQLGRVPASAEALRPLAPLSILTNEHASLPSPASTSTPASTYASTSADTAGAEADTDTALFAQTSSLVRIVARVHFWVGLGYGAASGSSISGTEHASTDDASTNSLAAKLAAWHRALPTRFCVALGGERVPRAVLEAYMLYQIGVGMLDRGRSSAVSATSFSNSASRADDTTSTFNVLLDKYRPSLALVEPHIVWFVFTATRACLTASTLVSASGAQHSGTARTLQTQPHLLNCREALAGMGRTWELARQCARMLERLMETDAAPGKRKRDHEEGEDGGEGARKRRDVEEGGGWGPGAEPFDFDVAVWGAELDGLGMGVGMNAGIGDGGGGFGMGVGLGLFDAQPGNTTLRRQVVIIHGRHRAARGGPGEGVAGVSVVPVHARQGKEAPTRR
ncbi:hypothetical protein DFH09DRAFT_1085556 [Mycena vulgaris]|nr:hypothetical protein DFH09DRAFT_1085556 [Mycena vulgaris]